MDPSNYTIDDEKKKSMPSVKDSLMSLKFVSICVYSIILQTRLNSVPGWTFTWLQWSFGRPDESNLSASNHVDLCMDIFGFMFFASIFISPIPSLMIKWRAAKTGSLTRGKLDGLTFLFVCTTALGAINSVQMCIQASLINCVSFVILYQFMRNFFFVSRSVVSESS